MLNKKTVALLLCLALSGCKDSKSEEPAPAVNPVAEKLPGLWERAESEWQYYDATGTAHNGLPWRHSSISSYAFTNYGQVRVNYTDGSGGTGAYELSQKDGRDYIRMADGYGLGTKTEYLIESITSDRIELVATYKDVEYTDTDAQQRAQASRAVNTVTLLKE